MQHHGRNFVTAALGRHRSMHDRGERGTVPNKLHGESRAWVHDSAAPSRSRVWKRAFRYTIDLTCLPSLCRAGDIRSRPPAAKRERGTRPPLPDGAGLAPHGDKQVTTLGTLTAPTPVSCRNS